MADTLNPIAQGKYRIQAVSGMTSGSWTAVTCQLSEAHTIQVFNPDSTHALSISTDGSGTIGALSIPAGGNVAIQVSPRRPMGFAYGETICYVQGAGSQPVVAFTA